MRLFLYSTYVIPAEMLTALGLLVDNAVAVGATSVRASSFAFDAIYTPDANVFECGHATTCRQRRRLRRRRRHLFDKIYCPNDSYVVLNST